jgi:hypothetical protein
MRLALAAVAALALAATGCGGVEGEPNLAQAAQRTSDEPTFAYEAEIRRTHGTKAWDFTCSGAVDNAARRSRMSCTDPGGPNARITIGGVTYAKSPGDGKWARFELPGSDDEPELSPVRMLDLLRDASRETARVGEEDVRGEPTAHYELTVGCEQAEIACDDESVVEVWVAEDGLVRRVAVDEVGTSVTMEFFDFGVPVDVEVPPADQVEEVPRIDPAPCSSQQADPITARKAIVALGRQGFDLDPLAFACSEGVAGYLGTRAGATPEVVAGVGYLTCIVYAESSSSNLGVLLPEIAGGAVSLPTPERRAIDNLECSLYADGPRADERLRALDAALAELKR